LNCNFTLTFELDMDLHSEKELIVSGGDDGLIKIWNLKKELIREIKFPEPISAVSFMNQEGDILVAHGGKMSSVGFKVYQPSNSDTKWRISEEVMENF